eukprot:c34689_g1_i1.p1 GENE.c34689_g1_i1~~c34689_g1_i1.p1  ORF type:complete len:428 (+),score=42.87 c34689_g1_i1:3-1286(+)
MGTSLYGGRSRQRVRRVRPLCASRAALSNRARDRRSLRHPRLLLRRRQARQAQATMDALLAKVPEDTSSPDARGMSLFLRGKTLNVTDDYSAPAEDALSKAAKLRPTDAAVWNALGEAYWKKPDLAHSRECFETGLSIATTSEGLRCLSMVLRMLPGDFATRRVNIERSLELARQAVSIAIDDGMSWYTLGNARLTVFFVLSQSVSDLEAALTAYKMAEERGASSNPDLHFNRANVYLYLEDYSRALAEYSAAVAIDPTWRAPADAIDGIARCVRRATELIASSCGLKTKKLNDTLAELTTATSVLSRSRVSLSALMMGPNPGAVLVCKVLGEVVRGSDIPQTVIAADADGTCFGVSCYNMRKHGIVIGNELWIPDPFLFAVSVTLPGETAPVGYSSIRVDNPSLIAINGVCSRDIYARTDLVVTAQ